ncbi:hemogen [Oryctolagus cuniculus]|uniref:hemogen n=1 Tax=Oryctolagus cuniculus TaxID=9986 RepID=UPI003879965D
MDLGKGGCHSKPHETPDTHRGETKSPEVTGTWILRNREQLRKRKVEAQEKQTLQWLLGEQKKRKWQSTGKRNQRGRKRQQNTKQKGEPQSQVEAMEKALVPKEKEPELPGGVTASPQAASPQQVQQVMPEEGFPEIRQESTMAQENPSKYQEVVVQSQPSDTCHDTAAPEDASPQMCPETAGLQHHPFTVRQDVAEPGDSPNVCPERAVFQVHPFTVRQDVAEPEDSPNVCPERAVLQVHPFTEHQDVADPEDSPNMCPERAVLQVHPFTEHQDVAGPEDLSPGTCQEAVTPQTLPPAPSEGRAGLEGCAPEAPPTPDVPQGSAPDTHPQTAGEQFDSEPDQGIPDTEGFFPTAQEVAVPKDLSTKTHQETVEPEYFSHKTCKEIAGPNTPLHETIQEVPASAIDQEPPGLAKSSPEVYQEPPEPAEYSPEPEQEPPEPAEYSPEPEQEPPEPAEYSPAIDQETPGPEDLSTKTYRNKDVPKECFLEPNQETGGPGAQAPGVYQEDATEVYAFLQETKEKSKEVAAEIAATPSISQEIRPENDIYSYVLF